MDLSDGDDDTSGGDVHTNFGNVEVKEHIGSHTNPEDGPSPASTQIPTSQTMTCNIVYNNDPHMYQNYYQNCQHTVEGNLSTDPSKDVDESNDTPLNDALTSFYSDLASIDNTTQDGYHAGQNKDLSYASMTKSSSEVMTENATDTQRTLQVTDSDISGQESRFAPTIGNLKTLDDRSNSPRALTPDRGGQDEKERRKKKAKLASGLSMKKKGVSNLVAKWQNIQEESSKQRPQ